MIFALGVSNANKNNEKLLIYVLDLAFQQECHPVSKVSLSHQLNQK